MNIKRNLRDILKTNIKYYRIKANLTQEDLAENANVTAKYISDLERGIFNVSLEKLEQIAEALNIEAYLLLKDDYKNEVIPIKVDMITKTRKSKNIIKFIYEKT
ncbi:MAG TPA: helix-turn-helix transcriptional regulator [Candidatus Caccenecus avistercoris]|nr:helix-turn-helix transcriptional regulator [Candidatus Caccenecus avistercoris]